MDGNWRQREPPPSVGQPIHPPDPGGRIPLTRAEEARASVSELPPRDAPNRDQSTATTYHEAQSHESVDTGSKPLERRNDRDRSPLRSDRDGEGDSDGGATATLPRSRSLSAAPHSSYAVDTSPTELANRRRKEKNSRNVSSTADPGPFESLAASTSVGRTPKDNASKDALVLTSALSQYTRAVETVGFDEEGALCAFDASPASTRSVTLEQRVNMIREMRPIPSYFEDVGHYGQSSPRVKLGISVLLENVANRVDGLLGIVSAVSPLRHEVMLPYYAWQVFSIATLGEPCKSAADASRQLRYARDWIGHVAAILEFLLHMRPAESIPPTPSLLDLENNSMWAYASGTPFADETVRARTADISQGDPPPSAMASRVSQQYPSTVRSASRPWTPRSEDAYRRAHQPTPPPLNFYTREPERDQPPHLKRNSRRVTIFAPPSAREELVEEEEEDYHTPATRTPSAPASSRRTSGWQQAYQPSPKEDGGALLDDIADATAHQPLPGDAAPGRRQSYASSGRDVSHMLPLRGDSAAPLDQTPTSAWHNHIRNAVRGGPDPATVVPWETVDNSPAGRLFNSAPPGKQPPDPDDYIPRDLGRGNHNPRTPRGNGGGGGYPPSGGGGGRGGGGGGYGGGGGRGAGGGGGGDDPGDLPDAYYAARDPDRYGPRMDNRMKREGLPSWDGNGRTVLWYFSKLHRFAEAGPLLHAQVGQYAYLSLDGEAALWWENLSINAREVLRQDVDTFIAGIRYGFLTSKWVNAMVNEYNQMSFRDSKHPREMPAEYLRRRAHLCDALFEYDAHQRVVSVLARTPDGWASTLSEHNCPDVNKLCLRATEMEKQLLNSSGHAQQETLEGIVLRVLEQRGLAKQSAVRTVSRDDSRFGFRTGGPARVNYADNELEHEDLISFDDAHTHSHSHSDDHKEQMEMLERADAYVAAKRRQRAPPKGGYPFPKDNTRSKKEPNSPCRACGGPHWDNECKYRDDWLVLKKTDPDRVAYAVCSEEEDMLYSMTYLAHVNTSGSAYVTPAAARIARALTAEVRVAPSPKVTCEEIEDEDVFRHRLSPKLPTRARCLLSDDPEDFMEEQPVVREPELFRKVTCEVVEDEESAAQRRSPKLPHTSRCLLSDDPIDFVDPLLGFRVELANGKPEDKPPDDATAEAYARWAQDSDTVKELLERAGKGAGYFETRADVHFAAALNAEASLPPPIAREYVVKPVRKTPPGMSSVGMSVLSAQGRLGNLDERAVTLRLDSGASISLIAEEFLRSLKRPPKIHTGMKVSIAQLTNKEPKIKGYVDMPIWVNADDGTRLRFQAELYVVPEMTIEVLLGEDFQLNYELDVLRNVELGTKVRVGQTGFSFAATSTSAATDAAEREVRSATRAFIVHDPAVAGYIRRKQHQRDKANRLRRKKAHANGAIRAWDDTLVPAETTVRVPIAGDLQQGREWYIERYLIPQSDETFLTVPNTLLDLRTYDANRAEPMSIARKSFVPVSNPTKTPRLLRAGTLLGYARDPQTYLDRPTDETRLATMTAAATAYAAIFKSLSAEAPGAQASTDLEDRARSRDAPCAEELRQMPGISTLDVVDDPPPPAAAEAPDPTIYSSKDLESILDISPDAPPLVRERAFELFRSHVNAFGFDGRLGHLQANAKVRTKPDAMPVSEPMHGASPEKRAVIEEQLKKWFELGVIEPSESPWAAPVVIVYRNGKPRFCVDYRKLNALTIADEFPIPRQADILSALSGSQVLSSLDALAGFNQLEIATEDVEKTAFRTHKGLFQFLRMPFGLRNGPAIFQRIMQNILAPFLWLFVLVYIDDIVVYSANYEEHLGHLDKILTAIERSGLTLSPNKCHFLYSSILLLGHKVSRLGLSTHTEKVSAILELERPRKLQTLQVFLGMVVYFQAFIPYYSFIVAPLFKLLKKGAKWHWGEEQERAFEEVKAALQRAPVLGHPIRHRPYRLYTDASDDALGACLQQVQEIRVGDLKGTPAYERLRTAHATGAPVPVLTSKMSTKILDTKDSFEWGPSLDDTIIETERVVSYWSRTFKDAERNYSATEREALAAKEALLKFQPFIEGERIILVTDHSSLQWARTFENANRRLAAWGLVFSAFPGLEIVHRAGRLHSNVDPLSRLPRDARTQLVRGPPEHVSPATDLTPAIHTDYDVAELMDRAAAQEPAPRMAYADLVFSLEDIIEEAEAEPLPEARVNVTTRAKAKEDRVQANYDPSSGAEGARVPKKRERADAAARKLRYEEQLKWKEKNPPPTLQITMSEALRQSYVRGYDADPFFKKKGFDSDERSWYAGNRFYRGKDGLLFFRDADLMPRLCVPKSEQVPLMRHLHESAFESAHAGATKLLLQMAERFYWPHMKRDVDAFVKTCDVCQKTKDTNFTKYGKMQPHAIPTQPYERVSLDLVTGLPSSNGFNAILVIVDLLSKHAQFIATDSGLDTVGFAQLFIKHVVSRFGVPLEVIADRDGRWLSHFFTELSKQLGTHMLLSSSHHPQHDGQTERTNRTLETSLRHYATEQPESWESWLPALEFAYNSNKHSSTGYSPYYMMYGFQPRAPSDLLVSRVAADPVSRFITASKDTDAFISEFEAHRLAARDAIALAQDRQAHAYNSQRRDLVFKPGQLVLIRPKSLELLESKGEGVKLVQRAMGPFVVQERVSDATYRIDLPDTFPMSNVIHISHLRKYEASPESFGERATLRAPRWNREPSAEYQVEKLVAHRNNRSKQQIEYLVRWDGYGPEHDSWLTAYDLRNAPARLIDYKRHHGL